MRKLVLVWLVLVVASSMAFAGGQPEAEDQQEAATQTQTATKGPLTVADFVDPKIPEEWFGPYPTASARGIRSFSEAPMLAARVSAGELPPVEERLPQDPPVVVPYDQVGRYGGTAIVWAQEKDFRGDTMSFSWPESGGDFPAGQPTPDGRQIIPYVLEGWDFNSDASQMTINFREGVRWSDGVEVTADDFMFWWEHVAWNQLISATPPDKMTPVGLENVEKLGKYSVRLTFAGPNPRAHHLAFYLRLDPGRPFNPAHHMEKFHPDFIGEAKVEEMARDAGYDNWAQFYLYMAGRDRGGAADRPDQPNQTPTVRPFVYIERSSQGMVWERNPYWPFVDTEGNQLPYIDQVRVNLASNPDIATAKMITGEADLSARFTQTNDIPLYKANEEKGGYRTFIYHRVYGSDVAVLLNLSHRDPKVREVFWDVRFRRALSQAIDRNEINNKVYFGQAVVMQATVPPVSKYFEQEYADAYAEYDVDQANALLDEMGMVDTNGDGWRERPDGETFNPVLVHAVIGPVDPTPVVELLKPMFDDVGLNIEMKAISRQLHDTMWPANEGDIHALLMDQMVDTAFGVADRDLSPAGVGEGKDTPWPAYRTWYITNGDKGMEPPQILKDTIEWRDALATAPTQAERDEAARKLTAAQAEYLWYIGTVAMAPHPVMVSNRLKNVPEKGIWDWRSTYMGAYKSQQFYIDE